MSTTENLQLIDQIEEKTELDVEQWIRIKQQVQDKIDSKLKEDKDNLVQQVLDLYDHTSKYGKRTYRRADIATELNISVGKVSKIISNNKPEIE